MKLLSHIWRFPVYLWIGSIYPILHLYAENFGMVHDHQVAQTIAAMLIATTLVYLSSKRLAQNPHKRAFYLGIASLTFSTSGHMYEIAFMPKSLLVWSIASAIVVIAIAIACHRRISQRSYARFTTPFNLIAGALLAMQIVTRFAAWVSAQRYVSANSAYNQAWDERPSAEKVLDSPDRPDIYYIIPDGYPSDERLLKDMNFDNSPFTEALRERGFVIAPHAQSNYATTQHSLATILNRQYYGSNPSKLNDIDHLRLSVVNSEVAHELLRLGYTYVQFLSGYVLPSPIADINRDFGARGPIHIQVEDTWLSATILQDRQTEIISTRNVDLPFKQPFTPLYVDSTLLRIVRSQLEKLRHSQKLVPYHGMAAQRFLDTIDEVETIAAMPEATFTIIHLLQPHSPTNFNENGDIIEQNDAASPAEFYADLRYSNSQFLRMIDTILQDSANEPIIVFQADHGSHFGKVWSTDNRKAHFDIYAGYYLPEPFTINIPKPFTLINSFALILNEVFAAGHDLQPDRLFEIPRGYDAPFEQVDVTDEFLHR